VTTNDKQLNFISVATAIAIILVVFGHAMPVHYDYPENDYIVKIIKWLITFVYSFHMPLFFFLSGYLYAHTNHASRNREYKPFLHKKFNRLILPYVIISTVAFLPKVGLSHYAVNPVELSWLTYFETIIYPWKNTVRYFWFLPTLFLMFALAPLLLRSTRILETHSFYFLKFAIFIFFIASNLMVSGSSNNETLFNYTGILHYFIYFWLGIWVSEFAGKWINILENSGNKALLFGLAILSLQVLLFIYQGDTKYYGLELLIAVLGIFTIISISIWLVSFDFKILGKIGKNSYQIYLFSWFFQVPVQLILYKYFHASGFSIMAAAMLIGVLGPIIFTHVIINYKLPGKLAFGL